MLATLALVLTLAHAAPATSPTPPTPASAAPAPVSAKDKAAARALLREGTRLFSKGKHQDALDRFNRAYALYPSPKLLYNIAQAHRELGHQVEALAAFEGFLAQVEKPPATLAAEVRRSVAELQAQLAELQIQVDVTGAELSLDGKPLGLAPLPDSVWVTPGAHEIAARKDGFLPAKKAVDARAGGAEQVAITLPPLVKGGGGVARSRSRRARCPRSTSGRGSGWRWGRRWSRGPWRRWPGRRAAGSPSTACPDRQGTGLVQAIAVEPRSGDLARRHLLLARPRAGDPAAPQDPQDVLAWAAAHGVLHRLDDHLFASDGPPQRYITGRFREVATYREILVDRLPLNNQWGQPVSDARPLAREYLHRMATLTARHRERRAWLDAHGTAPADEILVAVPRPAGSGPARSAAAEHAHVLPAGTYAVERVRATGTPAPMLRYTESP